MTPCLIRWSWGDAETLEFSLLPRPPSDGRGDGTNRQMDGRLWEKWMWWCRRWGRDLYRDDGAVWDPELEHITVRRTRDHMQEQERNHPRNWLLSLMAPNADPEIISALHLFLHAASLSPRVISVHVILHVDSSWYCRNWTKRSKRDTTVRKQSNNHK